MDLSSETFAHMSASVGAAGGTSPADQRRIHRAELESMVEIILCRDKSQCPISVKVHDLSPRGIGLVYGQDLPAGEQFITRLPRNGQSPVALLCTVVHSHGSEQEFRIGAEFTCVLENREPPPPLDQSAQMDRIRRSILS